MFFSSMLWSQTKFNDIALFKSKDDSGRKDSLNNRSLMTIKKHKQLNKFNPLYAALKGAMFVYQNAISPQISSDCVFTQSCSNFSKSAINKFGLIKGVLLTADRLTRCSNGTKEETETLYINQAGKITDPSGQYTFKHK